MLQLEASAAEHVEAGYGAAAAAPSGGPAASARPALPPRAAPPAARAVDQLSKLSSRLGPPGGLSLPTGGMATSSAAAAALAAAAAAAGSGLGTASGSAGVGGAAAGRKRVTPVPLGGSGPAQAPAPAGGMVVGAKPPAGSALAGAGKELGAASPTGGRAGGQPPAKRQALQPLNLQQPHAQAHGQAAVRDAGGDEGPGPQRLPALPAPPVTRLLGCGLGERPLDGVSGEAGPVVLEVDNGGRDFRGQVRSRGRSRVGSSRGGGCAHV